MRQFATAFLSLSPIMSAKVNVIAHPVVNAKLSVLRQTSTTPKDFREGIHDLGLLLGYEATRDLEEEEFKGQSPIASFTGSKIKPRIGLAPILRAGMGMVEPMLSMFPTATVYHIGIFREKISLQPVEYYSKLPNDVNVDYCFLLDPLIATGGTACAALNMIIEWGIPITRIKYLAILASQDGLDHIRSEFPTLEIWVCAIDPALTQEGFISPGLGDTGDRLFNTIHQ